MDEYENSGKKLVPKRASAGLLTRQDFHDLAAVPAEVEWFANIDNPRTRRAYQIDLRDFMSFVGIDRPEEFRIVTRAHLIYTSTVDGKWKNSLASKPVSSTWLGKEVVSLPPPPRRTGRATHAAPSSSSSSKVLGLRSYTV
jgi:hypothetical protein